MVERITMDKGNFLGYGKSRRPRIDRSHFGYDIYVEKIERTMMTVWVYDRNVTKRVRTWTVTWKPAIGSLQRLI